MAEIHLVVAWSLILFSIFAFLYLKLNQNIEFYSGNLIKKFRIKNHNSRVNQKLMGWREHTIPPKKIYPFLPLVPFIIIVFIFMNHMIFFAVITSDSMSPTFETGDIVLMQTIDKDAEKNDIIMFENKDTRGLHPPVIHRVAETNGYNITTKGDATDKIDDWTVEDDEVVAKAVSIKNKPIVIKNVGNYFINDYRSGGKYQNEFVFTSLMVATLKDLGIAIFVFCLVLYILLTVRDIRKHGK